MATIAVIGTLDTKGHEHEFVAEQIRRQGHRALLVDVGTGGEPVVQPDIDRDAVAVAGGLNLVMLASRRDRGECVTAMSLAATAMLKRLHTEGRIAGVISLGGGGGTAIATAAMRSLPIGFPKVMVSTVASGNTAPYIGTSDIVMFPSIVDVTGLNRVSKTIFASAAGAICGMVEAPPQTTVDRPLIVASMFGNTTGCVNGAITILEQAGFEVLVFHATGTGGRAMESLIQGGLVAGVLDITTTEWADELLGGVLSAGAGRLDAAAESGVPAIVVPGCLDMVNFGGIETVPDRFKHRQLYVHNPQATLMRTTASECTQLGGIIAEKVNASTGPVTVLIPTGGVSALSVVGQPFHDPEADQALFRAIQRGLRSGVEVIELPAAINDPAFATACAGALLKNMASAPRGVRTE